MGIYTKMAFETVKRSPFQAVSVIFVMSLTFFVASFVAVLVYASGRTLHYFETRPQIIAFIKDSANEEDVLDLKMRLEKDERFKDLKYVSKNEALEIYKKATIDNPLLSELVSSEIFPASLEFSVVKLDLASEIIDEIKRESIVDQVGFTANLGSEKSLQETIHRLKMVSDYVKYGGLGFVLFLAAVSFLILTVTVTMRMVAKKNEIEILALIGARPGFIKSPIILESLIYVVSGVFIGWSISLMAWLYFAPSVIKYFGQIPVLPREPSLFFIMFLSILLAELFLGSIMAVLGSLIATNRAFKKLQ